MTVYLTSAGEVRLVAEKKALPSAPEDGVIYVLDDRRNARMPNMEIRFSYRQHAKSERDAVLAVLRNVECNDPTGWQRTERSMNREWELHNLAYRLHLGRRSARHVDLDNKDEDVGLLLLIVKQGIPLLGRRHGRKRP